MPPDQFAPVAVDATSLHCSGVDLLLRGSTHQAVRVLRDAVAREKGFALANIALAVAEDAAGNHAERCAAAATDAAQRQISRRERQHVAVVALALEGKLARASALGREHLRECADAALIIHVLAGRGVDLTDLG